MDKKNSPCLDCEERYLLCHKMCYNYFTYRKRLDKIKKNKREISSRFTTYTISRRYRNLYGNF